MFQPTDYRTWTQFADHPIFSPDRKHDIAKWSHDPSRYCDLESYGAFYVEWYSHSYPPPPIEYQQRVVKHDIHQLKLLCEAIEQALPETTHELVLLDDFTTFVTFRHPKFALDVHPQFPDEDDSYIYLAYFEEPDREDLQELPFQSTEEVVQILHGVATHE